MELSVDGFFFICLCLSIWLYSLSLTLIPLRDSQDEGFFFVIMEKNFLSLSSSDTWENLNLDDDLISPATSEDVRDVGPATKGVDCVRTSVKLDFCSSFSIIIFLPIELLFLIRRDGWMDARTRQLGP